MIDIGYLVWTIIVGLIVGGCLFVGGLFGYLREWGPVGVCAGILTFVGVLYVWAAWPAWDIDYHTWRPVSGTVVAIDARMLGDGKSTTQNYPVRFGDGNTYRCDDSRCALVHPGDQLSLTCEKEWQYAATPGYVCRFVSTQPKDAR